MAQPDSIKIGDTVYKVEDILQPALARVEESEKHRDEFLPQVRVNRKFAAKKQHLDINPQDGRVLDARYRTISGVSVKMVTSDILGQYVQSAIGRLAANDYKPNFLAGQPDEQAAEITIMINDAYTWGWDNEWDGERKVLSLLRLLAIDGTAAIRCRYDRSYGEIIGDIPYKDGRPITDAEEARKYVAETAKDGGRAAFSTLREGKVCWEMLSLENILWPSGEEDPSEFSWEAIGRPIDVMEVHARYGEMADGILAENLQSSGSLTSGLGFKEESKSSMSNKVMVYTLYEKPNSKFKKGRTIIFTKTNLLDVIPSLPFSDHPKGPKTGVHYFRWQIVPGRFPGVAFIEGGIGAQTIRNKRLTQIDTTIDRGMPKIFTEEQSLARPRTGEPGEYVEIRPGAPLPQVWSGFQPGQWMLQDIKLQDENVEKAMGMKSISLGQPPQGVSAYSAMALLTENDALKLDPIAQDIRLGFIELSFDTMESMRNWPKEKNMEIAGPDGALRAFLFSANEIPERYLVIAPKQGALPRSQAAELQKINDIWAAAIAIQQPLPMTWYVESLNAGKPQKLPTSLSNTSKHKAELENIVMFHTKQNVPVSPEDDDLAHVEIHRAFQSNMHSMANMGDQDGGTVAGIIEQHCQEHLRAAQATKPGQMASDSQTAAPQPGSVGPQPGTGGAGTRGPGNTAPTGTLPPVPQVGGPGG